MGPAGFQVTWKTKPHKQKTVSRRFRERPCPDGGECWNPEGADCLVLISTRALLFIFQCPLGCRDDNQWLKAPMETQNKSF